MKLYPKTSSLYRMLDSRQLALKLVANVTYGYTGAGFSGRMPCSDLADSVVALARFTLENTIAYVEQKKEWGAEVVYGDTDSLFVKVRGRSMESAFRIGAEIAKEITEKNPFPMELKFEKVYLPCLNLAKKR